MVREAVVNPEQPIIDAHHHLFDRPGHRYLLPDYVEDVTSGHDVRASVFVQGRAMYRSEGPDDMKPVGETEFAAAIGRRSIRGAQSVHVCAGIVAYADLSLGPAVRPILEAHRSAGNGLLRGVRHIALWDPEPALLNPAYPTTATTLDERAFRAGFAQLAPLGLAFDAWILFHQIPKLVALARAFPGTSIVLDHCGGVAGAGPYEGLRDDVFRRWSRSIGELARCGNVTVKLGGLGMPLSGFGFDGRAMRPPSVELAEAWRPWIERCIEAFGTTRCMFESNFPHDKASYDYVAGWNAFKIVSGGASRSERDDLFWRTAARTYRLDLPCRESDDKTT